MSGVDRAIARLAAAQDRLVSTRQLVAAGIKPRAIQLRVSDSHLHRVHRGVYAVGGPATTRRELRRAALLALGPGAVLSHRDAAGVWDLRLGWGGAVDVTVAGASLRRRRGIAVHETRELRPGDATIVDGLPVTSVARTLLDLAEVVDSLAVRRAYEKADRLRLLDVRALRALLDRSNGRRGAGGLGRLLDYDPTPAARTRSELERLFLDLLRAEGLPLPLVNVCLHGFEVDAYWPDAGVVVELDGYEHHSGRAAFERDRHRLATLQARGLAVVSLTYAQVSHEPDWVVSTLRALLALPSERGASRLSRSWQS